MPFYEKGDVRIHYEEAGSGFPLLVIPGGGLNSTVAGLTTHPYNPIDEFNGEFRVIAADLRNANAGQSTGPLEADRPWDAYTDDHLGLMDHLGIGEFMVHGFCIGGPFIWNMLRRAPPYMFFRNASTCAIVMSGRRWHNSGPQPFMLLS